MCGKILSLEVKTIISILIIVIVVSALEVVSDDLPKNKPFYILSDYGPVSTPEEAQTTMDKLAKKLFAQGGGTIYITAKTSADFKPENRYQRDRNEPGISMIDIRDGAFTLIPTQLGTKAHKWAGFKVDRLIRMKNDGLGFWGNFAASQIINKVVSGSCSTYQLVPEAAKAGKDVKVYPETIEGISVGIRLCNYSAPKKKSMFIVKSVEWDSKRKQYYFTTDLKYDIPKGGRIGSKNMEPALTVSSFYNADHQTAGVMNLHTRDYGAGDLFNFVSRVDYQSNIISTQGDEGGVVCELESFFDVDAFRSEVESFDPKTGALIYKPGMVRAAKLAASRPIINLNEKKWLTKGHVLIVRPHDLFGLIEDGEGGYTDHTGLRKVIPKYPFEGKYYPSLIKKENGRPKLFIGGLILGSKDAPWDESVVGRYFAVDDDTEKYTAKEMKKGAPRTRAPQKTVRRWYRITEFEKRPDGRKAIKIMRIRWAGISSGSPSLFLEENYTWDDHVRPLKYVIAPGGLPYDISEGWINPVNSPCWAPSKKSDLRKLIMAPNGDTGMSFGFEAGDPIVQALGADPHYPRMIRMMTADFFPSILNEDMIQLKNVGRTTRVGMRFSSKVLSEKKLSRQKDRKPPYSTGIAFSSLMGTGIRFDGQVTDAAMFMEQVDGNPQPIVWGHQGTSGKTALGVDPKTGDMSITGGALANAQLVKSKGISATDKRANNLRGINVQVTSNSKKITVRFKQPEPDTVYATSVTPNWNTAYWVTDKSKDGFVVNFATPAPKGATLDWIIIR